MHMLLSAWYFQYISSMLPTILQVGCVVQALHQQWLPDDVDAAVMRMLIAVDLFLDADYVEHRPTCACLM